MITIGFNNNDFKLLYGVRVLVKWEGITLVVEEYDISRIIYGSLLERNSYKNWILLIGLMKILLNSSVCKIPTSLKMMTLYYNKS